MPRTARAIEPGMAYHVYDRGNLRAPIFSGPEEYDLFVGLLGDGRRRGDARLLAFCLMPNHWHLMLEADSPRRLVAFVARLKQVHTQRWHGVRKTFGQGHLYQGRFRSKVLEDEYQVLTCCRYVERNALAAHLVPRAEDWPWGSLWHRVRGDPGSILDPLPAELPVTWREIVNEKST